MQFGRGVQVLYIPLHANGDETHPDVEEGFVTSIYKGAVFCRFWSKFNRDELRTKANSEAVSIAQLIQRTTHSQFLIDRYLGIGDWSTEKEEINP